MKKLFTFSFVVWLCIGCDFKELNIDPNNLTGESVGLFNRLPAVQLDLMNILADRTVKRVSNTMGQVIYRQGPVGLNDYLYTPGDASNIVLWERLYTRAMNGAFQLSAKASSENAPHYAGIGRVLLAVGLGTATSIWGDVPYSQAFRPSEFTDPVFDPQEQVYAAIQDLLDQAITDFDQASGARAPAADDLFFGGDISRWRKTAHALKARYYLHTIKRNPNAYTLAAQALQQGLSSNADNGEIRYIAGNPDQVAPLFLERTSTRDTEVDTSFANLLTALNDPRRDFFTKITGSIFFGIRANYGPFVSMPDSRFPLMTYEECKFMEAEIAMQQSGPAAAAQPLRDGIRASLQRVCSQTVGSADADNDNLVQAVPAATLDAYADAQANLSGLTNEQAWERIFRQRYIALFLQVEVWNDYRRTENYVAAAAGLPNINTRTGGPIPRRYPYSGNEINFNVNAPANPGLFDRFWWDQ
ncbi:MAG: SusD/RagB family nutrient-binding outer membrane lipoprotein [Bacteroidia bacterium]